MPVSCECCGGSSSLRFTIDGYTYYRCSSCAHIFLPQQTAASHTAQVYDDAYFSGGGAGYTDYEAEAPLQRTTARRYGVRLLRHASAGALLDVGCASGATLQGFADAGWRPEGIEPNATMGARAAASGMPVRTGDMEHPQADFVGRFDAVAMLQVVAHLRDIDASFANAASYLRNNGVMLIETWDASSIAARIFGAQWHELSPPSVLRIFSRASLDTLASRHGFRRVAGGLRIKTIRASHAKSLLAYKRQSGTMMELLYRTATLVPDALEVPYLADDLFWHVYRLERDATPLQRPYAHA